jgi:hypothetical protein
MEQAIKEPQKDEPKVVSAEEFLAGIKPKGEFVAIPEFGPGKGVRIQQITLEAREKMRSACRKPDGSMNEDLFQVFSIVFGVAEPKLSHEQAVAIKSGDPRVADRIARAVWTLSNMTTEAEALKKD